MLGDKQLAGDSGLPSLRAFRGQAGALAVLAVVFFAALFLGAEGFSPTFVGGAALCAYGSLLYGGQTLPCALLAPSEGDDEAADGGNPLIRNGEFVALT